MYYAAVPAGGTDAQYFANGLNWMIDLNETLASEKKIRVVSVSAAPSGEDSYYTDNQEQWDQAVERAQAAGILVMDCRPGADTYFTSHGYYDPEDPDNLEKVRNGWAYSGRTNPTPDGFITVPCDFRTTVEQYKDGEYFYCYWGLGGESWGVPYAAGVLALGWQVNPLLTAEEIKAVLFESGYRNEHDELIVHPAAFIEAIRAKL